jgi:hypothetical protein
LRDIQTLLIGHFECIVLREFWEHGLEACIELGKFALNNLISDFGRSIDLDEKSENLIIICCDFIIRYIIIWNGRIDLSDKEHGSKRYDHQYSFGNRFGKQRFHGDI